MTMNSEAHDGGDHRRRCGVLQERHRRRQGAHQGRWPEDRLRPHLSAERDRFRADRALDPGGQPGSGVRRVLSRRQRRPAARRGGTGAQGEDVRRPDHRLAVRHHQAADGRPDERDRRLRALRARADDELPRHRRFHRAISVARQGGRHRSARLLCAAARLRHLPGAAGCGGSDEIPRSGQARRIHAQDHVQDHLRRHHVWPGRGVGEAAHPHRPVPERARQRPRPVRQARASRSSWTRPSSRPARCNILIRWRSSETTRGHCRGEDDGGMVDHRTLGTAGPAVSLLGLGCNNFGGRIDFAGDAGGRPQGARPRRHLLRHRRYLWRSRRLGGLSRADPGRAAQDGRARHQVRHGHGRRGHAAGRLAPLHHAVGRRQPEAASGPTGSTSISSIAPIR